MNQSENENLVNQHEVTARRETVEARPAGDFNRELEQLYGNYRAEKLQAVENETASALHSADKRLENTTSLGYFAEDLARLRAERGVDAKLAKNQAEIEQLGLDTKRRIEAVKSKERPEAGVEHERVIEQFQEKRGGMLKNILTSELASNGLDLVPFAGGGKMLVESIAGKTLSGEKLKGKDRVIHAAVGAGSLALDFTGIGELSKGGIILGKSVGLVEKAGVRLAEKGAVKSARVFQKTSQFMARHPQLVARAEKYAEAKIREQIHNIKDYRRQVA